MVVNVGLYLFLCLLYVFAFYSFRFIFLRIKFNVPKDLLDIGADRTFINFINHLMKENRDNSNQEFELINKLQIYKNKLSNFDIEHLKLLKAYSILKEDESKDFQIFGVTMTIMISLFGIIYKDSIMRLSGEVFSAHLLYGILAIIVVLACSFYFRSKTQYRLLKEMVEICLQEKEKRENVDQ